MERDTGISVSSFIAGRYLKADRSNRFFSFITLLSVAGVSIGVAAMIVVWCVFNGFEDELRRRFLEANAHIIVYRFPSGLRDSQRWANRLKQDYPDEVIAVSPFVYYETMLQNGSVMHAAVVRGTVPKQREKIQSLRRIVRPPEALDTLQRELQEVSKVASILIGVGLMDMLGAKVGDTIKVVEPTKDGFGPLRPFKIIGVIDSGLKRYDNRQVMMGLPTAQRFFKMGKRVTGLEVGLEDPWDSPEVAKDMASRYSLSIREWQSLNRPLFKAMQTERVVIVLITALVAGVACFNILTTMFVAVTQKQRDISILKALGATNLQIMSTFTKQGTLIGLIGGTLGILLALGISATLERYQFIDLPDLYLLGRLPVAYDPGVYGGVFTASVLAALIAGVFPAWLGSRVDPVKGFQQRD